MSPNWELREHSLSFQIEKMKNENSFLLLKATLEAKRQPFQFSGGKSFPAWNCIARLTGRGWNKDMFRSAKFQNISTHGSFLRNHWRIRSTKQRHKPRKRKTGYRKLKIQYKRETAESSGLTVKNSRRTPVHQV